jgi:ribosomal protein L33
VTIHSTLGLYPRPVDGAGDVRSVRRLECVECGRVSRENERDWTARLTGDDEVVVFCPACDEREFGA